MPKTLQEIADFYPIGLSSYGSIEGLELFSSKSIEDRIIDWCYKSQFTKKIAPTIERKIRDGTIVVGYLNDKTTYWFWKKFKNWIHHTVLGNPSLIINGYFSPDDNRIVILLDSNVNILGNAVRYIPNKLVHELVHYAANDNISRFLSVTMNKYLIPYYRTVITEISPDIGLNDNDLKSAIVRVTNDNEGLYVNNANIYMSGNTWYKLFLRYKNKHDSLSIMNKMSLPYLMFIVGSAKNKYKSLAYKVMDDYYDGYLHLGFDAEDLTIPGQEFRFPSEVVAIASENKLSNGVASLINST